MPKIYNLIGKRYGKLLVLSEGPRGKRSARQWLCQCDCGATALHVTGRLLSGRYVSCNNKCGRTAANKARTVHGASGEEATPAMVKLYDLWRNIKYRCKHDPDYAGRGISIHDRWAEDFNAFAAAIGDPPSPKHSLDRFPNNDGNYEPGNVRWATFAEQNRNKRANIWIEWNGKNMILADWATELGVPYGRLKTRYRRGKRPPELFRI